MVVMCTSLKNQAITVVIAITRILLYLTKMMENIIILSPNYLLLGSSLALQIVRVRKYTRVTYLISPSSMYLVATDNTGELSDIAALVL